MLFLSERFDGFYQECVCEEKWVWLACLRWMLSAAAKLQCLFIVALVVFIELLYSFALALYPSNVMIAVKSLQMFFNW